MQNRKYYPSHGHYQHCMRESTKQSIQLSQRFTQLKHSLRLLILLSSLITKGWSVFHTNYLRSLDINPLPNKQPSTMRQFLKKTSASFTGMGSIRVRRWAQRALEYHLKTFIHRSSFLLVPCVSCEHITQEKAVFTRGSEKCHMKNFSKKEAVYIC